MRFSVVIPVYNVKEYLPACVDSVLQNDLTDCEIILVDDGSTDGVCPGLCDDYVNQHPDLIRVIHQENRGLGGARNAGLEAATGEYLLFVDSDDTIVPQTVSVLWAAAEQSRADVLAFNFCNDDGCGHLTPHTANVFCTDAPFRLEERKEFLLSMPSAWSRAWKRSLFLETGIRYPDKVWYEDIRTTMKLFAAAGSIFTVDASLYRYLQRPGSIMSSAKTERNREILDAFDDLLAWFSAQGLAEAYQEELTFLAVQHIRLAATVRVARQDPKHPLLGEFDRYLKEQFPGYTKCTYLPRLSRLHRLLFTLAERRCYRTIRTLFRLKEGA